MEKKQFQAESKRLLDLMINSIYTHKEIFLREIISNASDALDKLAYLALTDENVGLDRSDFQISLTPDKSSRTLTVSDNGIGMSKEDLENNLGVIARSGSFQFKRDMDKSDNVDIIGQFGVGFYSAFMVADKVTVVSKRYGENQAWRWESQGADGYTISECDKDSVGTDVIMHIKDDSDEEHFSDFLDTPRLSMLIKRYSDYIHYPIRMELEHSRQLDKPVDAPDDYKPQWETVKEWETVNSMVPLWQRPRSKVSDDEFNQFYREKFGDWEDPLCVISASSEGTVTYKALLFIPSSTPYDFYTRDFQKGLQLYSSGVLIMDKCPDLLPDCFRFVRGVVDSPDFSLNISREVLQHDRQLKIIANALEKKLKNELLKLQKDDREKFEKFWGAFGRNLKYGVVDGYGAKKELLRDLLLFPTSKEGKLRTLAEYVADMPADQPFVYYACADSVNQACSLPQAERIREKGYELLCLTEEADEFVMQALGKIGEKEIKSVNDQEALPETEEEKEKSEKQAEECKNVLDFIKQTLGEKITQARVSKILKTGTVCLTADGPMSIEMEKYFNKIGDERGMKAAKILELNADAPAFQALKTAVESDDTQKAAKFVELLYDQALLIAGLPLEDAARHADLVCSLMC